MWCRCLGSAHRNHFFRWYPAKPSFRRGLFSLLPISLSQPIVPPTGELFGEKGDSLTGAIFLEEKSIAWEENSARGQAGIENCSFGAPKETNNADQAVPFPLRP